MIRKQVVAEELEAQTATVPDRKRSKRFFAAARDLTDAEAMQQAARLNLTLRTSSGVSGYEDVTYRDSAKKHPYVVRIRVGDGHRWKMKRFGFHRSAAGAALTAARVRWCQRWCPAGLRCERPQASAAIDTLVPCAGSDTESPTDNEGDEDVAKDVPLEVAGSWDTWWWVNKP